MKLQFKSFVSVILLLVVIATSVSACGTPAQTPLTGDVWVTAANSTVYWINQAMQGAPFTQIFTNGAGNYFVMWNPSGANGVGFTLIKDVGAQPATVVLDWFNATGGKGNLVNFKDAASIAKYMEENGWKTIPATSVPMSLKAVWTTTWQGVSTGVLQLGSSLISIIIVPVIIIPDELLDPYHEATIMG